MVMLLLTELTRLDVHLSATPDGMQVDAPAGALSDDLRRAMSEHKAALLCYASLPCVITIDGLGVLTGKREEQDLTFVAPERQEAWGYKIGVASLCDGTQRFYWPRMVLQARPEDIPE